MFKLEVSTEEIVEREEIARGCIQACIECWDPVAGGFCGGIGQNPHTAPTYAALLSLVCVGTPEALSLLKSKRKEIYRY